jgi:uncharacterized membrane protein YhaH (DUF805 family)
MIKEYLKDNNGNDSSTRVAFWYGILWSTVFTTIYAFVTHLNVGEIVALFTGLSASFFGLKLIQKNIENKSDK